MVEKYLLRATAIRFAEVALLLMMALGGGLDFYQWNFCYSLPYIFQNCNIFLEKIVKYDSLLRANSDDMWFLYCVHLLWFGSYMGIFQVNKL